MDVNPVNQAVQSFSAVNDVFRQDRLDEQNKQQREFENQRQAAADARAQAEGLRAQETHNKAMEQFQNQKNVAMGDSIKYKSMKQIPLDADELTYIHQNAPNDPLLDHYLKNPDQIAAGKNAIGELHNDLEPFLKGTLPDSDRESTYQRIMKNATVLDPLRLQGKKIVDIIPSPTHGGFAFEVEKQVPELDESGKPKVENGKPVMKSVRGVLTENGQSAEENPNDPVKFYKINDLMGNALQRFSTLDNIQNSMSAAGIKYGDKKALDQAISATDSKDLGAALDEGMKNWDDSKTNAQNYAAIKSGMLKSGKPVALVDKAVDDIMKVKEPREAKEPEYKKVAEMVKAPKGATTPDGQPVKAGVPSAMITKGGKEYYLPQEVQAVSDPLSKLAAVQGFKDKIASQKEINLAAKNHEKAVNAYYKSTALDQKDKTGPSEESATLLKEANAAGDAYQNLMYAHKANYKEVYTGGGTVVPENVARRQNNNQPSQKRTSDPDLKTAQAYLKKYGSKEAAMAAWHKGE